MSGICGFLGAPESPDRLRSIIARMADGLGQNASGTRQIAVGAHGAIAISRTHGFAELAHADGLLVAIAGTPRFDDAALASSVDARGMAATIAASYRASAAAMLEKLVGHFELAVIDDRNGSGLLASDRVGVHAPRYCAAHSGLVFGSNAVAILRHPDLDGTIDAQALYDYVYFHVIAGPRTAYAGINRLMPGEFLEYRAGRHEVSRYWQMRFDEHAPEAFEQLKQKFLTSLQHGVRHAVDGADTGAFLSGGTDSSTVAGLLGQVTGQRARTYSIGFDAAGYDEIEYARITARHFDTVHREYYVTADDIVDAAPAIAASHDQPFGNSSAVPAYYCAKLAREDGITRLLAGDGGDELFGGNERYAKQYVFSLYERVPAWLRSKVLPPLLGLPGAGAIAPLRKAKSYVDQASVAMPDRLQTYNLLERLGKERMFAADFFARIDTSAPLQQLRRAYLATNAQSLINRMLALDLQITLADNDLPKVTGSCELAGIDVAFPLLDHEVVEFSARLAPEMKLKGTRLRYFFKEALRDLLPKETIAKKKHGFGLPFGPWLQTNARLKALAYDSLSDVRKRGIFDPGFLDELTSRRVSEHASYYGSLVWVVMMLELWFKAHRDTRGTADEPAGHGGPARDTSQSPTPNRNHVALESVRS